MPLLRVGSPALILCLLLLLLPQVHAFGAGSESGLNHDLEKTSLTDSRYRVHLGHRGQELATWRH